MKQIIQDLAPAFLLSWWRRRRQPVRWDGDYASWSEARRQCAGYDEPANLARVRDATARVREGGAAFERDGVAFAEAEYVWPLLAALQSIAAAQAGRLDVVDFGGALGSTYLQHRVFLDPLPELRWSVVEQPAWVAAGRAEFADSRLSFHENLNEVAGDTAHQVLLLSSVLPYLPGPHEFLAGAVRRNFPWILVDRTGILRRGARDRLTIQTVRPPLFHASYPCWFFLEAAFVAHFARDYILKAAFPSPDQTNLEADFRGFFFQRKP